MRADTNKVGSFRQDNDCHWYFIPAKEVEIFDNITDEIIMALQDSENYYDLLDLFEDKFSQYRIDDPFSLKLKIVA